MSKAENQNLPDMVFTIPETAKILRSSDNYVYKLIEAGLLKSLVLGRMKVRKTTLEEFLKRWDGWDLSDPKNPVRTEVGGSEKDGNNFADSGGNDVGGMLLL